jgi:hypothetical protein
MSQFHHSAPKLSAPAIHVPIRPTDYVGVGPEPKTVQDNGRRLRHRLLRPGHDVFNRVGRTLNHQGIMNRGHDIDASLRRQTTRQPHHLGPVGLAWEIPQRPRFGVGANADRPTEYGMEPIQEHGMGLGPASELLGVASSF